MPAASQKKKPSTLQSQLIKKIARHIRDDNLFDGGQVTEVGLAETLNVSRTPARAALFFLAEWGIVEPIGPRRGFRVVGDKAAVQSLLDEGENSDEFEEIYLRIAADYLADKLPNQFSEADIMRIYGVGRRVLLRVLQKMTSERVIERNPGYGWRFAPMLRSTEAHDDSYRFRLAVEPASLLQVNFKLDESWAARSRADHERFLKIPVKKVSQVELFEVNADFHLGLAKCSNNNYFVQAMEMQNQVRRFQTYNWTFGDARVHESCWEHLAILDAIVSGDNEWAANLMRRHLDVASRLKPQA